MGFISRIKKQIPYVFPINGDEIDRTHNQHYVYRTIWSRDFSAPVEGLLNRGARVLDIGCGPGTWILELGTKYINSKFLGIDANPTYPTEIRPSNVSFEKVNVLKGLPFGDNEFEFVIMRFMKFVFCLKGWKKIIKEMIRVCKPNGWIEIMEDDFIFHHCGPRTEALVKTITKELKKKGIEPIITPYISSFLHSNSNRIVDIVSDKKVLKLGSFGDKEGELHLENLKWGAKNLFESEYLFRNEVRLTYNKIIEDFVNECNETPTFFVSRRFYARKKRIRVKVDNKKAKWGEFFGLKDLLKNFARAI